MVNMDPEVVHVYPEVGANGVWLISSVYEWQNGDNYFVDTLQLL